MKRLFENKDIFLLTLGTFFQFAGLDGFQQYYAAAYESRGESQFAVASLVLLYFCFWFFSQAKFAPTWVGKMKPALALSVGALPYSLMPLAVTVDNKPLILIGAGLVGTGAALYWVTSGIVLNAASSEGRIGKNTSLQLTALYLGGMLSTLVGTPFILHGNFAQFTVLCGALSAVGALTYLFVSVERMSTTTVEDDQQQLNSRYLFLSVFSAFFVALLAISSMKILVSQTMGPLGVTLVGNGIKFTAIIACLAAGILADRVDPVHVLLGTSLAGLIGLMLFVSSESLVQLTIASMLIAVFFAGIRPIYLSLIRSRTSREGFSLPHAVYVRYTTQGMFAGLLASLFLPATLPIIIASILIGLSIASIVIFGWRFPVVYVVTKVAVSKQTVSKGS